MEADRPVGIMKLSPELLRIVLDHINPDPDRSIGIDRRAWLSVESFHQPEPPAPEAEKDVASFRLVCKRFAEVGIPFQFTRLSTRFTLGGLGTLHNIAEQPQLARSVKKFTYLVPTFYAADSGHIVQFLKETDPRGNRLDLRRMVMRTSDHQWIRTEQLDRAILKLAFSAFTNLQHVQLLKVQDQLDGHFMQWTRMQAEGPRRLIDLHWTKACHHAIDALGYSSLAANSRLSRVSIPQMDPRSAFLLHVDPGPTLQTFAKNLTCLELQFFEPFDLDSKMRYLSGRLRRVLNATTNMQSVHIGFPNSEPLTLSLDEIFGDVQWERLRAFGVDSWRLSSDEIIDMARRHRRTLRGFRLRKVLLKEGSMWRDVLEMLRNEMTMLQWVSLRRADYASHIDDIRNGATLVAEDDLEDFPASDSDDESRWEEQVALHDHGTEYEPNDSDSDSGSSDEESVDSFVSSSSDGSHIINNPLAPFHSQHPSLPSLFVRPMNHQPGPPLCTCNLEAHELGDCGSSVTRIQRKMWEQWAIRGCLIHDAHLG